MFVLYHARHGGTHSSTNCIQSTQCSTYRYTSLCNTSKGPVVVGAPSCSNGTCSKANPNGCNSGTEGQPPNALIQTPAVLGAVRA